MDRFLKVLVLLILFFSCKHTDTYEGTSGDELISAFDKMKRSSIKRDITYLPIWQDRIEFEGNTYVPLKTDKMLFSYTTDSLKYSLEGKVWLKVTKRADKWQFSILKILPSDPTLNGRSGIILYEDFEKGQLSYQGYVDGKIYSSKSYNNTLKLKGYVKKGHIPPPCNFIYESVCAGEGADMQCTTRSIMVCSDATSGGGSGGSGGGGGDGGGTTYPPGGGSGTNTPPIIPPNTPSKEDKEIIDSLQGYPCAQAILVKLPNLKNKISEWLGKTFANTNQFNITFSASKAMSETVDGEHYAANQNGSTQEIRLNGNMLLNASQEYIAATMFHEALHAFLHNERFRLAQQGIPEQFGILYPGIIPTEIGNQTRFLLEHSTYGTLLEDLKKSIKSFNPNLSDYDAMALAKGGVIQNLNSVELSVNYAHKKERQGQNAHKILLLIILVIVCLGKSQAQTKYFVLEDAPANYKVHQVAMSAKKLYGIEAKVECFNILYDGYALDKKAFKKDYDQNLILFSVLPDLEGGQTWKEISLDSIQKSLIDFGDLKKLYESHTYSLFFNQYGSRTKFLNDYKIIVRRTGKFYVPANCLLQFYAIRNRPDIFANPFGTINTHLNSISIKEVEKIYKDRYPYSDFPVYGIGGPSDRLQSFDRIRDRREYLSKMIDLKTGESGYQFWTFTDWYEHRHNYELERGIDRFVYTPEKGIIGGSFDFYFYFHRKKLPIKYADFLNNIKEEKVMIGDAYK